MPTMRQDCMRQDRMRQDRDNLLDPQNLNLLAAQALQC